MHIVRGLDATNGRAIPSAFEVAGEKSGVVLVIFHQQDAKRGHGCWLVIDLVERIKGAHRVV
jgi:hypothetical protein